MYIQIIYIHQPLDTTRQKRGLIHWDSCVVITLNVNFDARPTLCNALCVITQPLNSKITKQKYPCILINVWIHILKIVLWISFLSFANDC